MHLMGRLSRWIILIQEYDFEIFKKPKNLNMGPNHIPRVEIRDNDEINDEFSNIYFFIIDTMPN